MALARLGWMVIGVVFAATCAQAQEIGDWQKGRAFARQVCAECHAVGRRSPRSPNGEAPSFVSVANTPGMTAVALNVFLQTSHRSMPNLILATEQKNNVIAYILSLKK
jgi:mono/diheme cytochrome c family protein